MSKTEIYFFVKTFTELSHAEAFLDGVLYMNTLAYFASLEKAGEAQRGDRNEGTIAWLQPSQIKIQVGDIEIDGEELSGPIKLRMNRQLAKNVFCMHAGHIDTTDHTITSTPGGFEQQLKIPEENILLGQHSVLISNVSQFLGRVKSASIKENIAMHARLVDYYNPEYFHGQFNEDEAAFKKHKCYSHQREYRIAIERDNQGQAPFELKIGSIRDIARPLSINLLNKSIVVTPTNKL